MHADDDGALGFVWLAIDERSNVVWCYDSAVFRIEMFAVIADSIHSRGGNWIPVAWRKKDEPFATKLQNAKINVLPEPSADNPAVIEVMSREIWLRMEGSRFKCDPGAYQWLNEYNTFYRAESKVPDKGFPLMAATRHAIEQLPYAKAQAMPGSKRENFRKAAIF